MIVFRAICYSYAGALIAGIAVAIFGVSTGMSIENVATASVPIGIVFGLVGLGLPFLQRMKIWTN